ncbi:MAG: DUF4238 domain-containing protein, partial [Bacteroidales bacterium]|nr:DUF4238 domain-containing protein [Bacteroidales bacterium]
MAYKKKQHINPETYLRHFSENKFVYVIKLNNKFQRNLYREGIGHKMFSKKNYYNFPNRKNEPILEDLFAKIETNDY